MAKNWTLGELFEALNGTEEDRKKVISDVGKRFPLTVNSVVSIISAINNEYAKAELINLMKAVPDWLTVRKVENVQKNGTLDDDELNDEESDKFSESDFDDEEEIEENKKPKKETKKATPKKSRAAKKVEPPEDDDEEEDFDGEEEEEEEVKPAKKAKKGRTAKKAEPPEEDDDDDWDI